MSELYSFVSDTSNFFLNPIIIKHLYIVQFCGTIVGDRIKKKHSGFDKKQQVTLKFWNGIYNMIIMYFTFVSKLHARCLKAVLLVFIINSWRTS